MYKEGCDKKCYVVCCIVGYLYGEWFLIYCFFDFVWVGLDVCLGEEVEDGVDD